MKNGKLTVAIVGMGFGSCFLPIYLKHPDVEHVIMVDTNPDQLKALADMYLLDESYYTTDFEAVLQNPDVDAVHLVIPPALHAPMSVQVLNAGKHCACTIPMGMSMKELEDVIKARKASGKHYMFMETSVYTREYLYVKELYESGAMGKLQYMRCAHYQDMEGCPLTGTASRPWHIPPMPSAPVLLWQGSVRSASSAEAPARSVRNWKSSTAAPSPLSLLWWPWRMARRPLKWSASCTMSPVATANALISMVKTSPLSGISSTATNM